MGQNVDSAPFFICYHPVDNYQLISKKIGISALKSKLFYLPLPSFNLGLVAPAA